jgi:hypothetical protein
MEAATGWGWDVRAGRGRGVGVGLHPRRLQRTHRWLLAAAVGLPRQGSCSSPLPVPRQHLLRGRHCNGLRAMLLGCCSDSICQRPDAHPLFDSGQNPTDRRLSRRPGWWHLHQDGGASQLPAIVIASSWTTARAAAGTGASVLPLQRGRVPLGAGCGWCGRRDRLCFLATGGRRESGTRRVRPLPALQDIPAREPLVQAALHAAHAAVLLLGQRAIMLVRMPQTCHYADNGC